MFLSASEIIGLEQSGDLQIVPFDRRLLKPASYVLRVGRRWRVWEPSDEVVDPWASGGGDEEPGIAFEDESFTLPPGGLCLVESLERVAISRRHLALLSGLSHVARYGLAIHQGSMLVSPGFGERAPTSLTFEVTSSQQRPVRLRTGMPLCHLLISEIQGDTVSPEAALRVSAYHGRKQPGGPALQREFSWLQDEGAD